MDDGSLSQLLHLLSPALPYLVAAGDKAARTVAEKAGKAIGDQAWEVARKVWGRLRPALEAREAGQEAVQDLLAEPGDELVQKSLLNQVRKLMKADPELAAELMQLIGSTTVSAPGGIAVAGPVGSVVMVSADTIQLIVQQVLDQGPAREADVDLHEVTRQYLQLILDRYSFLELKGMGVTDRVALQLPLLDLFVPLRARVEIPEGETWDREVRLAGRRPSDEEAEAMGRRLGQPQPVLDLLAKRDGLIVLGDPGSGKTTLLKHLALTVASGRGESLGLGGRLPILLPLAAYATALDNGTPTLRRFMAEYAEARGVDLPVGPILDTAIESGRALLLLDGLDEVADLGRRNHVVGCVKDLISRHCCGTGNRYLLTSRIVGYREVRPTFPGHVGECTLVDLDDNEIEAFIGHWTAAIERAIAGASPTAALQAGQERRDLLEAVHRSPAVRHLASNPLLLTILALMKRQGVTLPEHRVELYDHYVATMLRTWNLARSLDNRTVRALDLGATLRILAPLALWMQETDPGRGLVTRHALDQRLRQVVPGQDEPEREHAALRFMNDLRDHAGLLLDRGGNQYGFIHLTFQEYLAAVALARKGQQSIEPVLDALAPHIGDPAWHETALLTIGYLGLIQKREEAASALVDELIRRRPGDPGEAVVLAGRAVADCSPGGVSDACRGAVVEALLETMRDCGSVPAVRRLAAGTELARLGDPRPEVMTVDAMELCYVPPGPFWMGAADGDGDALDRERPGHDFDVPYGYWIGRFPVTVAQLRSFVDETGLEPGDPECLAGPANATAVSVSWDEAQSVCRWLAEHWVRLGFQEPVWNVRLPSEAEWEKAARGGRAVPENPIVESVGRMKGVWVPKPELIENRGPHRIYPWGDRFDPELAHTYELDLWEVGAVGCFARGASPYGCEQLAGGVWEWTRSQWEWADDPDTQSFGYPYDALDGREDESAARGILRAVRGGAFFYNRQLARCSSRNGHHPEYRSVDVGFRVVVAPLL